MEQPSREPNQVAAFFVCGVRQMTLVLNGHDMSGTTAHRPTNAKIGQPYFDTTLNAFVVWNGSAWQDASIGLGGLMQVNFVYGEALPLDASFFVACRAFRVKAIIARPLVVGSDAGAVTAVVKKVASGTAIASGTALHTGSIDLKGTINTNQSLTLSSTSADLDIASGTAIGVDVTGVTTAARGVISVLLNPA